MVSKVDCSNLSIILNLLVSKARLDSKHRDWEKCLEREEFHGDDWNPLHSFDDTYLPEEFAVKANPSYRSVADVKLFVSYIYLVWAAIVDCSRVLY